MIDGVDVVGLAGVAAILFFTIVFFAVFLVFLYRVLRFVWARLPASVLEFQGPQLDKLLGIVVALILVPDVARYAWTTIVSLLDYVAGQIRRIASASAAGPPPCGEDFRCVGEIAAQIAAMFGDTALGIVRSLRLNEFPVTQFVLLLLVAVIATQIISILRHGIVTRRLGRWVTTADSWIPAPARQRIVFGLLVVIAFYLGLSALLAIPLFQDKSRPPNLTVESLDKALAPNTISVEVFERTFAQQLPPLREVVRPGAGGDQAAGAASPAAAFLAPFVRDHQSMLSELQFGWTALRQTVLSDQTRLREQAKIAFASGLDSGIGGRQIAEHYYELVVWHQGALQRVTDSLRACWSRATAFSASASELHDNLNFLSQPDDRRFRESQVQDQLRRVFDNFSFARRECSPAAASPHDPIPRRKSFAEGLGPIGRWSGWLLETEQMPVVIIVGLVGFSLLGATVSRAVRVRQEGPNGALTLDDLLIVVAGGTTAAIVVFLAAYGGLAVLGGNSGDPNPYVLFVTCLIGAVYSEDVWTWARRRLLSSATRAAGRGRGGNPRTSGNRRPRTRTRNRDSG
jgi:hypothetical protein